MDSNGNFQSWGDAISASLQNVWTQFLNGLPAFLAAFVVLVIGILIGGQLKFIGIVGKLQSHAYIHQGGMKNLPTAKQKGVIIQITRGGVHETRNGGVGGGRDWPIRDREGTVGAIKITRFQRDHVVHLWPCSGGIGTGANRQNARVETVAS